MKKFLMACTATVGLTAFGSTAMASDGMLDALDPCIEMRDQFADQRRVVLEAQKADESSIPTAVANEAYRKYWRDAKYEALRPEFDTKVAPMLKKLGHNDMDAAYKIWFEDVLNAVPKEKLDGIINAHYRQEFLMLLAEQRTTSESALESQKKDLDKACKMDAGNQALRVVLNAALAPINNAVNNFQAAKDEKNVATQAIRATTGVSLEDIKKHGLTGGKNSEANKALRSVGIK